MVLLIATLVQKWVREIPLTRHRSKLTYRKRRADFLAAGAGAMDAFLEYDPGLHPCSTGVGAARVWLFPHADGAVDNSLCGWWRWR